MKNLFLVMFCLCMSSCMLWYEPYPRTYSETIAQDQAPRKVRKAMVKKFPDAAILQLDRSTFGSKFHGYSLYRYTYKSDSDTPKRIVFDEKGEVVKMQQFLLDDSFHDVDAKDRVEFECPKHGKISRKRIEYERGKRCGYCELAELVKDV